jgi:predicted kinase
MGITSGSVQRQEVYHDSVDALGMNATAPNFIVVTGLPASGKSTIGQRIASALSRPLIDKDDVLEALFESLGVGDDEWRHRLSRAADAVMEELARQMPSAVLVSWWRHPLSDRSSGTPTSWLRHLPGRVAEVHCACSPLVAAHRFRTRKRHDGHLDASRGTDADSEGSLSSAWPGPLRIGRFVEVNTEADVDLPALIKELSSVKP